MAHPLRLASLFLLPFFLPGCTSFEVVRLPTREADLYPFSESHAGVSIAVDEITEPERVQRYFGARLIGKGVYPVQVLISNYSDRRIAVRPSDVLLLRGRDVVDPLPLQGVVAAVENDGRWTTDETSGQIAAFFREIAFRETFLAPDETYQGVIFFQAVRRPKPGSRFFRVASLFPEPALRLRLVATDVDTGERIPFGPFGLSSDERDGI